VVSAQVRSPGRRDVACVVHLALADCGALNGDVWHGQRLLTLTLTTWEPGLQAFWSSRNRADVSVTDLSASGRSS